MVEDNKITLGTGDVGIGNISVNIDDVFHVGVTFSNNNGSYNVGDTYKSELGDSMDDLELVILSPSIESLLILRHKLDLAIAKLIQSKLEK